MYDLNNLEFSLLSGVPRIISAILLLILAFVVAAIAKSLVVKGGKKLGLSRYMDKWGLSNNRNADDTLKTIGTAVFWIVFILFLPGILDTLNLSRVAIPFGEMTTAFLSFLPKLLGATLVLIVGYVIAKVVRDLLTLVLRRVKVDELQAKAGIAPSATTSSFSTILANIAYVLIWIPIIIAALEILDINAISEPAITMLNNILAMLPRLFIAAVLVILGVYVAKMVGSLVSNLLSGMGINNLYGKLGMGNNTAAAKHTLSDIIGGIVKFIIALLFVVEAINVVNLEILNSVGIAIIGYLPFFISAIVILGVGVFLGIWVEGLLTKYTSASNITAMLAKCIIVFFAVFMTLNQLGISMFVVNTAFLLIMGALSIAFAISFGVGGRDFAKRSLERFERKLEAAPKASDDPKTQKAAENMPDPMEAMKKQKEQNNNPNTVSNPNKGTNNNPQNDFNRNNKNNKHNNSRNSNNPEEHNNFNSYNNRPEDGNNYNTYNNRPEDDNNYNTYNNNVDDNNYGGNIDKGVNLNDGFDEGTDDEDPRGF
ncbi:mechanosensitive ion channel [Alloiococcus sp. CFN-8]|uniref:mechanosensitive ion channel n=1 Tax=Alloiococcus sp. CFN-8 TaxID=3416081 RepID=UPI003CF01FA9